MLPWFVRSPATTAKSHCGTSVFHSLMTFVSITASFSPRKWMSLAKIKRNRRWERSEEHTSELQSRPHLVCRLLLEKKKKKEHSTNIKYKQKNKKINTKSKQER